MSNEPEIQAQFDRLMNQYGYDEEGRPSPLLMRAFHESVLNRQQLRRLQDYFASMPGELSIVGGDDDDTALPPDYEEAATKIVCSIFNPAPAPVVASQGDQETTKVDPLELRPELKELRHLELSLAALKTQLLIARYEVDVCAARRVILCRLYHSDGRSTAEGQQIAGLTSAIVLYATLLGLTVEVADSLCNTVSESLKLLGQFILSADGRIAVRAPEDKAQFANLVTNLLDERKPRREQRPMAPSEELWARLESIEVVIRARLVEPWKTLVDLIYDAVGAVPGLASTFCAPVASMPLETNCNLHHQSISAAYSSRDPSGHESSQDYLGDLRQSTLLASFNTEYNRIQCERNVLVAECASRLLDGNKIPEDKWFVRCMLNARQHFLLQQQQWIAREAEELSAQCLHAWWEQRKDDLNHALRMSTSVAEDVLQAIHDSADILMLNAGPYCVIPLTKIVGGSKGHKGSAELVSQCEALILTATKVMNAFRRAPDEPVVLDDAICSLKEVESTIADIRIHVARDCCEARAFFAGLEADLMYERVLRCWWFGANNPLRSQSPEFYNKLSVPMTEFRTANVGSNS